MLKFRFWTSPVFHEISLEKWVEVLCGGVARQDGAGCANREKVRFSLAG